MIETKSIFKTKEGFDGVLTFEQKEIPVTEPVPAGWTDDWETFKQQLPDNETTIEEVQRELAETQLAMADMFEQLMK